MVVLIKGIKTQLFPLFASVVSVLAPNFRDIKNAGKAKVEQLQASQ